MYKKSVIAILVFALLFIASSSIPIKGISEPAFAAGSSQDFTRLGGKDRFETNAAIVDNGWQHADTIVVVRGTGEDKFADAMASTILAYQYDAPILLVDQNTIPKPIKDTIAKLQPSKAFIIGGPTVVSDGIKQTLKNDGIVVDRIYGQDRRETAIKIGDRVREKAAFDTVMIATGYNFPDALSAAPFSALNNVPILFVTNKATEPTLDEINRQALTRWGVKKVYILGGTGAISQSLQSDIEHTIATGMQVTRISGNNRYETSLNIAKQFDKGDFQGVTIATGKDYPDSLAGTVLAAKNKTPILLADDVNGLDNTVKYIADHKFTKQFVLGGEGAVPGKLIGKLFNGGKPDPQPDPNPQPAPNPEPQPPQSEWAKSVAVDKVYESLIIPEYVFISFKWDKKPGAERYELYHYENTNNEYVLKASVFEVDFFKDYFGYVPGKHKFKVEAIDSAGKVIDTAEISMDTANYLRPGSEQPPQSEWAKSVAAEKFSTSPDYPGIVFIDIKWLKKPGAKEYHLYHYEDGDYSFVATMAEINWNNDIYYSTGGIGYYPDNHKFRVEVVDIQGKVIDTAEISVDTSNYLHPGTDQPKPQAPQSEWAKSITMTEIEPYPPDSRYVIFELKWLNLDKAVSYKLYYEGLRYNDYLYITRIDTSSGNYGYVKDGYVYTNMRQVFLKENAWFRIEAINSSGKVIDSGVINVDLTKY
ncbi:cell wall-binding repeat-containing protein [Mahella sp.]|uniref:cell wall-binding repeat-containing protein n=1 Tax=Mahella sp. TaxID=2798721 RepID=UPI0025BE2F7E|nr:cell wall-binding repeat-containing protein [Mahella sp.]MBZ4665069.1 cell wall binding repeat 2-containing protein [Mahella sp.]